MPQLAPGAGLRGNKTRADTKSGSPDYLITRLLGRPRLPSETAPRAITQNWDGSDFGLLRPMGCSMSSLEHGDCGETSKSNLTRLRAEPLGTNPSLATASGSPAIR